MLDFFKQYAPYYRDYRLQFFLAFLAMGVSAASTASIAYLVKPVLDEIFINKNTEMLAVMPLLVVAAYAGKGLGYYAQIYYISYIGKDIIRRLKDEFLSHILRLDMQFFNKNLGGEMISRLVNDTNKIQMAVSNHVSNFLRELLTAIGLIGIVIYQSPKLAFFGLIVLPLAFYPLSILAKRMKKISRKVQEKTSDIVSSLGEIFNNIEIIKANTTENLEQNRVAKHNQAFFEAEMKVVKTSEAVNPLMELLGAFAAAGVIVIGGQEVIDGNLSVGAFFSFMTALFMLYTPIRQISSIYNKFQEALAANERVSGFLKIEPEIKDGEKKLEGKIASITLEALHLRYGQDMALINVNAEIPANTCVALVGQSGSGKSSLVNLLLRFYDPQEGRILINGEDLKHYTTHSIRSRISIVTQRVYIFNDTVAANVAYGEEMDEERVRFALQQAHAWNFVEKMEQGMETVLDEFGTNLSGGQRQRIAIARALYKNPEILVLDEATSALDNESEREITRALEEIKKERIVILIAHRPSTLKLADSIWVLESGQIVCSGSEEELLENCEVFQRLYRAPELMT